MRVKMEGKRAADAREPEEKGRPGRGEINQVN